MVAVEPMPIAMLDQPGGALGAVETVAARPAQRQRRIAAPIEEQERLLTLLERLRHGAHQRRGQPLVLCGGSLRMSIVTISGSLAPRKADGQFDVAIAPGARVHVALDRGRRRGENDGKFAEACPHDCHVAGLVVNAVFLLEALVVLLVDDD